MMPNRRQNSDDLQEKPVFSAMLTPHRSLSKGGFIVLMIFVSMSCFASGMFFLIAGAWPVMITMGLDVLAIWIAFKLNYRSGRQSEEISMWSHLITIKTKNPSGKISEHSFNPFWAKFHVDRHVEFGVTGMRLREKGAELELGNFLNPDDKDSFASAFTLALAKVRH